MSKSRSRKWDFSDTDALGLRKVPHLLARLRAWDDLVDVLTNLSFIEAKCAAGMTSELLEDFRSVESTIPDAADEVREQKARTQRLRRYAYELVEYAKKAIRDLHVDDSTSGPSNGAPILPVPPSSWVRSSAGGSSEPKASERLQRLRAFATFTAAQSPAIARYSSLPGSCCQHALNSASTGPVRERALQQRSRWNGIPTIVADPRFLPPPPSSRQLMYVHTVRDAYFRCVALTPDGRTAVTGGDDRVLRVWDVGKRELLTAFTGHPGRIFGAAVTPDGRFVASCDCDGYLCVWNIKQEVCTLRRKLAGGFLYGVSLSADGSLVAAGGEGRVVHVVDCQTEALVRTLRVDDLGEVRRIACTPDGATVVTGHDVDPHNMQTTVRTLNVWDVATGKCVRSLRQPRFIHAMAITPDARVIVTGDSEGVLACWRGDGNVPDRKIEAHEVAVSGVAVSHDGRTALSCGADHRIRLWDLSTGAPLRSILAHTMGPADVAASADCGLAVSVGDFYDAELKVWDLASESAAESHAALSVSVNRVQLLPHLDLIASWGEDQFTVASLNSPESKRRYAVPDTTFSLWSTSPDRRVFGSAKDESRVTYWRAGLEQPPTTWEHSVAIQTLAVAADGQALFLSRWDGVVERKSLLDDGSGSVLFEKRRGDAWLSAMEDCRYMISGGSDLPGGGGNAMLRIWDLDSRRCNLTLRLCRSERDATLSGDSRLVFIHDESTIGAFDLLTRQWVRHYVMPKEKIVGIRATPSGRFLLVRTESDNSGDLWLLNLKTGSWCGEFACTVDRIRSANVSPGEDVLLTHHVSGLLRAWSIESGRCIAAHYEPGGTSAISDLYPDGRFGIGTHHGAVTLLQLRNVHLALPVVTAVRRWASSKGPNSGRWEDRDSVLCPWCSRWFHVSDVLASVIESIQAGAHLRSPAIPVLTLPDEAWADPRLVSKCPKCAQPIRFNPFAVDNRHGFRYPDSQRSAAGVAPQISAEPTRCWRCGCPIEGPAMRWGSGDVMCNTCVRSTVGSSCGDWTTLDTETPRCDACGRDKREAVLRIDGKVVCDACCECAIEELAQAERVESWTLQDVLSHLGADQIYRRLTALWRFDEVSPRLDLDNPTDRDALYKALVENLGFVSPHASSCVVRQLAFRLTTVVGSDILPTLLGARRREPWQVRANALLAAGSIDPEAAGVREALFKAARDPRPEVRARVPDAISHHDTGWTRELVVALFDDREDVVRDAAWRVTYSWDIAAGLMSEEDHGLRKTIESVLASDNADELSAARAAIPRSLMAHRATWARKVAERLAEDPDPAVRAEVEKLYEYWAREDQG